MQKKIIALAIAAAVSAPAFADNSNVTIYGVANMSYDMVSNGTTAAVSESGAPIGAGTITPAGTAGASNNKVSSNTSRIGFKGNEDLGDGLSAVWQVESLIAIDNAGGTFGTRNTFAGLSSSSMGTVLMGRHDTPYNISTRKFDVFTDGIADNRSLMGGATLSAANLAVATNVGATAAQAATALGGASAAASFDGRQPDVIAYISPSLGGFTGAIAYLNLNEGRTLGSQAKASATSLAGMYGSGPFYGSLAYEVHNLDTVAAGAKESAWKLGLGYTQDAITVGFAYEKTSDNLNAGTDLFGHKSYYLSGKYALGNDAVKAAYTNMGNKAGAANTGASQFSLGYDHALSKRTTVYGLYTKLSNDANVNYALAGTSSGGGAGTQAGLGASPSAFSFGMKHTF